MFIVNVEGAIFKEGKWLVIRRSEKEEHAGGLLSLVGGKVDVPAPTTQTLETALKREIFEEIGVEVEQLHYACSSSFYTAGGTSVINIVFRCECKSGEPFAKSPDEVAEILWLSTGEILSSQDAPDYLQASILHAEKTLQTV